MKKPKIIVTSADTDDAFQWMSAGWYAKSQRGTPKAERLFAKAKECIGKAENVPDACRLLEEAGFEVKRG